MKRLLLRVGLLLAGALLALALAPAQSAAPPPGALLVPAGLLHQGDLASFGRPIHVAGQVVGDVTSWGGPIIVDGAVTGDVVSYAGGITLGPGATVGGSILAIAGGVVRESSARVAGRLMGERPLAGGAVAASVLTIFAGPGAPATGDLPPALVAFACALATLTLSVVCVLVWPHRTAGVGRTLLRHPGRSLGLGLLSTLMLALLLPPLSALLALTLLGLPLLLGLLLAIQIPYIFGLAGLARALARRLGRDSLPPPAAAALGALVVLLPLLALGTLAPLWSAGLFYLVASIGMGAAIISRGGAY